MCFFVIHCTLSRLDGHFLRLACSSPNQKCRIRELRIHFLPCNGSRLVNDQQRTISKHDIISRIFKVDSTSKHLKISCFLQSISTKAFSRIEAKTRRIYEMTLLIGIEDLETAASYSESVLSSGLALKTSLKTASVASDTNRKTAADD